MHQLNNVRAAVLNFIRVDGTLMTICMTDGFTTTETISYMGVLLLNTEPNSFCGYIHYKSWV